MSANRIFATLRRLLHKSAERQNVRQMIMASRTYSGVSIKQQYSDWKIPGGIYNTLRQSWWTGLQGRDKRGPFEYGVRTTW